VQDCPYLDSFVCYCNQSLFQRKKYEQFNDAARLKVWFQDYDGTELKMETKDENGNVTSKI
jgi:hypothetical protein